jgi:hypothetical protein
MHYNVALWRTTTSPIPIATLLVEAEDTRQAAHAALIEHKAVSMGAVVVMCAQGQQTYFDAQLAGEHITCSREAWSPRFPGVA